MAVEELVELGDLSAVVVDVYFVEHNSLKWLIIPNYAVVVQELLALQS